MRGKLMRFVAGNLIKNTVHIFNGFLTKTVSKRYQEITVLTGLAVATAFKMSLYTKALITYRLLGEA
jgi:hypothetical protein